MLSYFFRLVSYSFRLVSYFFRLVPFLRCTSVKGSLSMGFIFVVRITLAKVMTTMATAVAPYSISEYERRTYYQGISLDPPELLYRSDLLDNPFPHPKGRYFPTPTKTVHGVFNTQLNKVWSDRGAQGSQGRCHSR
ncbi:hypothetical protein BJV74DRAFT_829067 [Russula compacta]|nr:hypothetical protein BJV74DRAFT_829067 [Russula compacta]